MQQHNEQQKREMEKKDLIKHMDKRAYTGYSTVKKGLTRHFSTSVKKQVQKNTNYLFLSSS